MAVDVLPIGPLLEEVRGCTACAGLPLGPRPILQAGIEAPILIAGQAPGRITHGKGRPFDDPSGHRLREWLGVDRDTFYDPACFAIIPMGFCFPGTGKSGDLPPRSECADLWRQRLLNALPRIRLTLMIGQYALRWHLGRPIASVQEEVRQWQEHWPERLPLPHPSPRNNRWLKNNPHFEREVVPRLRARTADLLGHR